MKRIHVLLAILVSIMVFVVFRTSYRVSHRQVNLTSGRARYMASRPHINLGVALVKAGKYKEAIEHFYLVHLSCPKGTRHWTIATVYLGTCFEHLDQDEIANKFFEYAGKFSPMAARARSSKSWERIRKEGTCRLNLEVN